LHALAGDIPGNGGVVRLACDLVDLVYIYNPRLCLLHVEVGSLNELEEYILHVFADVTGFGEGGRVGYSEGDVEDPS
jgi:hypothetical protein